MNKIISITLLTLLFSATLTFGQDNPSDQATFKGPSDFFPKERAQVLMVGSFHFDYPGMDTNKTSDENKIDVLQEPKKSEVAQLVEYIKKFKPTKIAIESRPNWKATEKLRKYKAGKYRNERDERFQLGMRLATDLEMDTIYGIDVESLSEELGRQTVPYLDSIFSSLKEPKKEISTQYKKDWYAYNETLPAKMDLLSYFKKMNSKESHLYGYGFYLLEDFKYEDGRGADILSMWWYNRNLRIFRKLQEITENKDDRILVIFGNGHAAILRQLIEASPEYDFVEFDSL